MSLWRRRDFAALWIGQTISEFGSTMGALPLTAILALHAGPAQMGMLAAASAAPGLLLGLAVGVWVDRVRRRPILIAADLGRAALLASIPAAWAFGRLAMAQVYLIGAGVGSLTVLFEVAYPSYLPTLVAPDELGEANAKLGMSSSLAEMGGQSIGGALIQWLGAPLGVLADAVTFVPSALAIAAIRIGEPPPAPAHERESVLTEAAAGVREVVRHALLGPLLVTVVLWHFAGGFFWALYALYAIRVLGMGPGLLGIVIACGGLGSLLGSTFVGRITRRIGIGRATFGAFALSVPIGFLIPLAHGPLPLAAGMLIAAQISGDFLLTIFFVHAASLRQALAPPRLLGRVNASYQVFTSLASLAGALAGGILGGAIGLRATMALGEVGFGLSGIPLLRSPLRDLVALPEAVPQPEA